MAKVGNAKYWNGVLYPENMKENWEQEIGELVGGLPYAYCKHTLDTDTESEHRKDHIHLILAFNNTTTYNHAFSVFDKLSKEGCKALNKIESCISIRHSYNYLIHDTETSRKKGKYLYPTTDRICGNNFDIGSFEQLSITEKNDMCRELCQIIRGQGFLTFGEFFDYVVTEMDTSYFELIKSYSGLFERLTKSNYYTYLKNQKEQ